MGIPQTGKMPNSFNKWFTMSYTPNIDKNEVHSHSHNPALMVSAVAFSVKWYFINKNQWEDIRCFLIISMTTAIPYA